MTVRRKHDCFVKRGKRISKLLEAVINWHTTKLTVPHTCFYNSPVSKGFLGTVVLTSFALSVPFHNYRHLFTFSYKTIFVNYEFWRLITCKIAFLDTKDLICGALLIYYFRIFERRFGSGKFASCLLASGAMSTALELTVLAACRHIGLNITYLPSGPYGLIFPFFVPYFCDIPRVAMTHIWGIPVTGKSFMYILGLQISSTATESIIVGVCGILSGLLYRINFAKIQHWLKVPCFLARLGSKTLGKLLVSPAPDNPVPMGATIEIQRQQQMERMEQQLAIARTREYRNRGIQIGRPQVLDPGLFANQINFPHANGDVQNRNNIDDAVPGPSGLQTPPPEDQVTRLVEMGFTRNGVLNALQVANNDINLAMNILLQEAS